MTKNMEEQGKSSAYMERKRRREEMRSIRKEVESLSSPFMTFRERKELESRKLVPLGAKPPKKQRMPLSVARIVMKKQKLKEEKWLKENPPIGTVGGKPASGSSRVTERRKPEQRVLKSTVGDFRNGVLDVKQLLHSAKPRETRRDTVDTSFNGQGFDKGKKKKGGGKKHGKKGGRRKRH